MAQVQHTPPPPSLEEAITVLFCFIDEAYERLNPHGRRYGALKKLSDSEILALALFQQLRGVESERSFLRDAERFFSHLFPGVVGVHPSSFHRRGSSSRMAYEMRGAYEVLVARFRNFYTGPERLASYEVCE